jgi:hypothetical protein
MGRALRVAAAGQPVSGKLQIRVEIGMQLSPQDTIRCVY